jgi:hypothetical protein
MIKDIRYLRLFRVKHLFINNKLVFNLDPPVLIYKGDAIYKGIKVRELNYLLFGRLFNRQSTLKRG